MNLIQQFWSWLTVPATAQSQQNGPSIGDRLLRIAADYLQTTRAQAQEKANSTVAAAPADNAPGARQGLADAPMMGQTLSDLFAAYNRK